MLCHSNLHTLEFLKFCGLLQLGAGGAPLARSLGCPHRRISGSELGPVEQLFLACAAGANDTSVVASADNRTACVSATSIVAAFFLDKIVEIYMAPTRQY
jgi:hypothetical protein